MVRYNVAQVSRELEQDTRSVDIPSLLIMVCLMCLPFLVNEDKRGATARTTAKLGCLFLLVRTVALWKLPLFSEHFLCLFAIIWQLPDIWTMLGTLLITQAQKARQGLHDARARRAASAPQPKREDTINPALAAGVPPKALPSGKSPGRGKSPGSGKSRGRGKSPERRCRRS